MIIGKIRDVFKVKNGKELSVSLMGKMSNGKLAVWWDCMAQKLVRISSVCKASVKATFSFVENVLRVPAKGAMKTSKQVHIIAANTYMVFHNRRFRTKCKGEAQSAPTTTAAIRCGVANAKYSVATQPAPTTSAKASNNISQKFLAFIVTYIAAHIKEVCKNIHTECKAGLLSAFAQKTELAKTIKMTKDVSVTTADTSPIEGWGTETCGSLFRFEQAPGTDIQQRSKAVSAHRATVIKVDSVCLAATATTGAKTGAKLSHWYYPELIDGCLYIRQAYSVVQDGETLEVI